MRTCHNISILRTHSSTSLKRLLFPELCTSLFLFSVGSETVSTKVFLSSAILVIYRELFGDKRSFLVLFMLYNPNHLENSDDISDSRICFYLGVDCSLINERIFPVLCSLKRLRKDLFLLNFPHSSGRMPLIRRGKNGGPISPII